MNILMLSNEFPPSIGGIQTHVDELSLALSRIGHQVDVVTRLKDKKNAQYEEREGVNIHRIQLATNHFVYDWQISRKIRSLMNSKAVDIVHVHGMRPLAACKNLNLPVVFTNHTSSFLKRVDFGPPIQKKMLKLLRAASLVIAPSQILVDKTIKIGYRKAVHFVSNGVDVDKFSPGESSLRKNLGLLDTDFIILFSGRLHKVKGVDCLAEATKYMALPSLHLVVAGDGDEREHFKNIVIPNIGSTNLHMLGAIPNSEMPNIYRGSNVAVLPSMMEATSISGLEAMACGLPLVASRVGGLPYIVDEGISGLLFKPGSSQELGAALRALYEDRAKMEIMGEKSRQRAVELFSWEIVALKTIDIYQNLIETF
ncbi:MAG: glycosyltransferase family 4 protein [Desulfuromonadales bacterium]|nr:glycosyltransferase family 4 protein [Desulfuromonadales bacterium]